MARGPATRLLYLYSCKNRNLITAANRISNGFRRHFHPYPCRSPQFPKQSLFGSTEFNRFRTFGVYLNFQTHLLCTLSKHEEIKSILDSAASLQPEPEPSQVDYDEIMCDSNMESPESREKLMSFYQIANRDPAEIYRELKDTQHGEKQSRCDLDTLMEIFRSFSKSSWASNQALGIYIGASVFPTAAHEFRNFFMKRLKTVLVKYLVSLGPGRESDKFLFPLFVEFCVDEFQEDIRIYRKMVESADMTRPESWFPFARAMKRRIIYHCGPTNSGKTYNALQRFMEAKKGIYCSPLRLLAMEVFDKVNARGVYCSLLTGQEKKLFPFSSHIACTVEMASTEELYDVAVIDEIQMMADPCRGYAWTRALLGLKADEIHLCGDPSVLNIVRKICSDTGDELVEQHYERFKPLVVEAKTLLGDLKNVRSGDCIVSFSRREIFEVKLAIEKYTKHRCCVIYGALPPETRRQQAALFNNQENEYDVLVASDAVGMGLNLNIRRTVFYNLSKYNGDKMVQVPASQVKQIAGRAGRRGSRYPEGLTTTLQQDDLDYLIECLKKPFDDVKKAGLFPYFEQVELFAAQLPDIKFPRLLERFVENCRLDGSFFLCQHQHIKKIANILDKIQGLSLEDRFNFCFAPVNIRDPKAMHHLLRFASSYAQNLQVNVAMGMPKCSARSDSELLDLETRHQVLSTYLWLSNHFEEGRFPYAKKAETMAMDIAKLLGESLINVCWKPESRNAGKSKQSKKEDDYERPTSIIKLHQKRKHAELAGELSTLYRREEKLLTETIPNLCWELAQLQDTYILQGDYDLKVMRQEFYINRQKAFTGHLINQLSRHQFLKIACQLEKKTMLGAYSLLKVIELELQGYLSVGKGRVSRCIALAQAASDVPEQGAVDDRDTFLHGVRDLLNIYSNAQVGLSTYVSAPGLVQQLSNLQSDLMTLQSDLDYILPEDRNRCINESDLIVKHHSQEMALQRRVFVDFFCNPERLRNQVKELTARVRALQAS